MSQGSTGNVIAALASFLLPGLGQLVQGRVLGAFLFFFLWAIVVGVGTIFAMLTAGLLGFIPVIGHVLIGILAALSCALWKPPV